MPVDENQGQEPVDPAAGESGTSTVDGGVGGECSGEPGIEPRGRATDEFDDRIVDVLSWVLDTETRARIYVSLRRRPGRTSDEVADATDLYPSTVREALAALTEDGVVVRRKRQSDGVGNNPYEYRAIAPSDLVRETVGQVQEQLNDLCRIDSVRDDRDRDGEGDGDSRFGGPVTIRVEADDRQ